MYLLEVRLPYPAPPGSWCVCSVLEKGGPVYVRVTVKPSKVQVPVILAVSEWIQGSSL